VLWKSLSTLSIVAVGVTGVAWARTSLTAETVRIEHVRIVSTKTFAQVKAALEAQVPQLNPAIVTALSTGDVAHAQKLENGAPLFIFLKRDHGALLKAQGGARNVIQYDIGNPLTASRMTKHKLAAALYAPIRVRQAVYNFRTIQRRTGRSCRART
jgi:hypothetical protein